MSLKPDELNEGLVVLLFFEKIAKRKKAEPYIEHEKRSITC